MRQSPAAMVRAVNEGRFQEGLGLARYFRDEGFRGAALFEILFLLKTGVVEDRLKAKSIIESLRPRDLYPWPEIFRIRPLNLDYLEAAEWILKHEWRIHSENIAYNGAHRLQRLATCRAIVRGQEGADIEEGLQELETSLTLAGICDYERRALQAQFLIKNRAYTQAFKILIKENQEHPNSKLLRESCHLLFDSVPRFRRVEYFEYSEFGGITNFGVSPILGAGFVLKQYHAGSLGPLDLWRWIPGWKHKLKSKSPAEKIFWARIKATPLKR